MAGVEIMMMRRARALFCHFQRGLNMTVLKADHCFLQHLMSRRKTKDAENFTVLCAISVKLWACESH